MDNYSITLPSYSIGSEVYSKIGDICSHSGKTAVMIGGKTALSVAKEKIMSAISDTEITVLDTLWYGVEASITNINALKDNESVQNADMIFAVGGGKALDTCKALGYELCMDVYTLPTIASNCAATTAVSILYNDDGSFLKPYFLTAPPKHSFIDTAIICAAPRKYIWAGMGDTYAKYFEAMMSSRGEELVHYHALGRTVSQMCYEPVIKYGAQAMKTVDGLADDSEALTEIILAVVVTTGIASIFLTNEHIIDYNTGLAHAVFYALTSWHHIEENHLHGEVVGYGVLILLLVDGDRDTFEKMYTFNKSVGLPTKLADVEMSADDLDELVPKVAAMKDIDHNPYVITEDAIRNAFLQLEERNKQ